MPTPRFLWKKKLSPVHLYDNMTAIIKRIILKDFTGNKPCPTDKPESFKVYTLVDNEINTTFQDIKSLAKNDLKFARDTYVKILTRAGTGQTFPELFDGQQFHKGHEFSYEGSTVPIWRLWLAGAIRVYFIFSIVPNKNILILKTLAKRKDDLNNAEKAHLEEMVKKIIACQKSNQVYIEDKS